MKLIIKLPIIHYDDLRPYLLGNVLHKLSNIKKPKKTARIRQSCSAQVESYIKKKSKSIQKLISKRLNEENRQFSQYRL
jgi:hypothetical protein